MMEIREEEWLGCCGSTDFAKLMAKASPFPSLEAAIEAARDIWFNHVNVTAWLEAFAAHPQIGESPSSSSSSSSLHPDSARRSLAEQSTAFATASASILQGLSEWNSRYRLKFGFLFLTCATGKTSSQMLDELKERYPNRPLVEFEIAAKEQMKITELRIAKLFSDRTKGPPRSEPSGFSSATKMQEDRLSMIGGHLGAASEAMSEKAHQLSKRTRPPITTHVLDVSRGAPASGVEVLLEVWNGTTATRVRPRPSFGQGDTGVWSSLGASVTDKDGRSGQLMDMVEALDPGIYRISFDTGKYCPGGFFPYVSIAFEIRESQQCEHFHVPLLISPFSFTTYRGS